MIYIRICIPVEFSLNTQKGSNERLGRLPECFREFFNGTVSPFHMNRWYCEHPDCLESFGEVMGSLLVKGLISSKEDKIIADHKVILINESQ